MLSMVNDSRLVLGVNSDGFSGETLNIFLGMKALQNKRTVHRQEVSGFPTIPLSEITACIDAFLPEKHVLQTGKPDINGRPRQSHSQYHNYPVVRSRRATDILVVWDEGYYSYVTHYAGKRGTLNIASLDPDLLDRIIEAVTPFFEAEGEKPRMHVVVQGESGPRLLNIGESKVPLIRENYAEKPLIAFDHFASEIARPDPCGRLVLLLGLPGTGKTYFIEGLTLAQPRAQYVLLPSNLVQALTGPDLLVCLTSQFENSPSDEILPVVLIVEDADECLVSRGNDNLPAISTLLNLADGILGRCLDVRVIATSNAKAQDIDKALLRPGRLCQMINFDKLSTEHSQQVFQRLLPPDSPELQKALGRAYTQTNNPHPPMRDTVRGFGSGTSTSENNVVPSTEVVQYIKGPMALAEIYQAARKVQDLIEEGIPK